MFNKIIVTVHLKGKNNLKTCLDVRQMIDGFGFCPNVTFEDDEFKDNKALNDQGTGGGTNCHSPTQPQNELELDLIMGRKPPPPRNF